MNVMREFRAYSGGSNDICEHLGLLRGLASDPEVKLIVEFGFRKGVSTTALCSTDKPVHSYDIADCRPHSVSLCRAAPKFRFIRADSLQVEIPECELLFIDSLHTYKHLREELRRHAPRCMKWIALHDTQTFGSIGKDGSKPGLMKAILEFLEQEGREWTLLLHLTNNNGMTILQRRRS